MNTKQIISALNLVTGKWANEYATKLQTIYKLVKELKPLPGYGYTLAPEVGNVQIVAAMPVLNRDNYSSNDHYTDNLRRQSYCRDRFGEFLTWQKITLYHSGGSYVFDIPTGNELHNYILTLIGAGAAMVPTENKKVLFEATIAAEVIAKIKTACTFVSKDTLRPAMCGVLLHFTSDTSVTVVGTDAHRLYKSGPVTKLGGTNGVCEYIVPVDACKALIASKCTGPITFKVLQGASGVITAQFNALPTFTLIDARYPQYDCVIPQDNIYHVQVNRHELLQNISVTMPAANKTTNQVVFSFNGTVKLSAQDIDFSCESLTEFDYISCNVPHDTVSKIALNGRLFTEVLKQYKCPVINLEIAHPSKGYQYAARAIVVKDTTSPDLSILMPLMLS